jgi:aspartate aminotransferase-like enzyme
VERRLRTGGFDAITVVHSETSTGVLNPLEGIAGAVRAAETATGDEIMLLVDGVTSVGGALVETAGLGLDWTLTGSHKALALPPGLAFGTASERMLERAARLPGRGQYFDLLEFDRHWRSHQTPNTPALNLIYALVTQMDRIAAEGVDARADRHLAMARLCHEWTRDAGAEAGLRLFAPEHARSPTVTAIGLPSRLTGSGVAAAMRAHGFTIGAGYGKLKDSTIRIGHMGDHTVEELGNLLDILGEVAR